MSIPYLCHLLDRDTWQNGSDKTSYAPSSLAHEGFIHLSTLEQAPATASRFYAGRDDMLLLVIAVERLTSPLRWEDLYGHGSFPHLYGPLNKDAVVVVVPLPCHNDGTFTLPEKVKSTYAC